MLHETRDMPDRCLLQHRLFSRFSDPLFRRSEDDGTPVMVVMLGDRQAVLPLRALQHEFAIADDSTDGRMLAAVAAALEFVTCLRVGDPLPAEVLSGEASWEPEPEHLRLAEARLRLRLVAGARPDAADDPAALESAADPGLAPLVQAALDDAAAALNLPDAAAVRLLLQALAGELAYVEALRDRLLRPVQALSVRLANLARGWHGEPVQLEKLRSVRRLNTVALQRIGGRFQHLDAQTGEVLPALRNLDSQRTFIRSHRDWLYRTLRAWQPVLRDWDGAGPARDQRTRAAIEQTYRFLAPRYMPATEWIAAVQRGASRQNGPHERSMIW